MNKTELINAIAQDAELTKTDAKKAVEGVMTAISSSLEKGEKVSLVGFGSFSIGERKARTGRHPQTGKTIKIAAKKVVKFKAGAELNSNL